MRKIIGKIYHINVYIPYNLRHHLNYRWAVSIKLKEHINLKKKKKTVFEGVENTLNHIITRVLSIKSNLSIYFMDQFQKSNYNNTREV